MSEQENFEELGVENKSVAKKSNRKTKIAIGAALLLLIPVIGSVFAANIQLNSNASIQFGQGVQATLACDSAFVITPKAAFINNATPSQTGTFSLDTITVSSFDMTACANKTLTFKVIKGDTGVAQDVCTGGSNTNQIGVTVSSSPTKVDSGCDYSFANITNTSSGGFDIVLTTQPDTTLIDKITVQSS